MKKHFWWILLAVVCVTAGLVMAVYHSQSQLVFGYDQARDAFQAYSIWHNFDLKILGPSTDIPGVFHGVLWYYFLAGVYFLGRSPQSAALIYLLTGFLAVPLLGLLAHKLFKDTRLTCLAIALFALSPLFQAFTRWLSNPGMAVFATPLLLIFLWSYLQKPRVAAAFFTGFFFGILIQAQFAYAVLLLLLPVFLWQFRLRPKIKELLFFSAGLGIAVSSFILAEIKFGALGITSMTKFLGGGGADLTASQALLQTFDRVFQMLGYVILPWPKLAVIILLLALWAVNRKSRVKLTRQPVVFLLIWSLGLIVFQMFSTAVSGSAHVFITFAFPVVILFSYFFLRFTARYPLALIILPAIFLSEVVTQLRWVKIDYSPLAAQHSAFLSREEKVIDYTYNQAEGRPFIINSITNPLYVNTLWAYLYQFYGLPKYGYLPFWGGRGQTGFPGSLPEKPFGEDLRFLIFEDTNIIPEFYLAKMTYEEDKVSDVVGEQAFGQLNVQKRLFHPNKGPIPLPAELLNVSPNLLK